jgi:hypothetical protein
LVILGAIVQTADAQGPQVTFPENPRPEIYFVDEAGLLSQADRATIAEAESNTAMEQEEIIE